MKRVPILLYHSIDDHARSDVARWSVTVDQFREHMDLLRDGGWTTYTVSDLTAALQTGQPLPDRSIAVTFDDGFENVLTDALPAMTGMTSTVYMTSGYLRDRSDPAVEAPGRMLASRQLSELATAGWEVGVHGHRHVALDAVRRATARREIVESKQLIEGELGATTRSFAYPYGYHDAVVQRCVREAGFVNAVGVKNAHTHDSDDLWGIARITIERGTTTALLAQALMRPDPPIAPPSDRLVTFGWRAARRIRTALVSTT